jgi:hypothetical protein
MAIFWERKGGAPGIDSDVVIPESFQPGEGTDAERAAHARGWAQAAAMTPGPASLRVGPLLVALAIVAALLVGGVIADAADLPNSSKALFGLATTAFGIVVGLLTGEKSGSS